MTYTKEFYEEKALQVLDKSYGVPSNDEMRWIEYRLDFYSERIRHFENLEESGIFNTEPEVEQEELDEAVEF